MYQVPPPKEDSGCVQTAVISGIILRILLVPILLILGAILSILLALFAFAEHPLLGLGVVGVGVLAIIALSRWEWQRIGKDIPHDDDA